MSHANLKNSRRHDEINFCVNISCCELNFLLEFTHIHSSSNNMT